MRRWRPLIAIVVGAAGVTAAPRARADHRAVSATGEFVHRSGLDGGAIGFGWTEPVAAELTVDGTVGAVIATLADGTHGALANPQARVRWRGSATTTVALALTLPAASRDGGSGRVATAMAAAHRIDPAPWLPATTLTVGAARTWRRPLGHVTLDVRAGWSIQNGADDLPLIHVDALGGTVIAERIELTAAFRTTGYGLAAVRDEDFVHTLAIGARYHDCRIEVDGAFVAPVDAADRALDSLSATLTVRWRL